MNKIKIKQFLKFNPTLAKVTFALGALGVIFFFAGYKAEIGEDAAQIVAAVTITPAIILLGIRTFWKGDKEEEGGAA